MEIFQKKMYFQVDVIWKIFPKAEEFVKVLNIIEIYI